MNKFKVNFKFWLIILIGAGILAVVLFKDTSFSLLGRDNGLGPVANSENGGETMKIRIYFNNSRLDPEFSCNKVFPTEREVAKTQAPARAALEELLKGASETEKGEGFFSSLNSGVKIQSLAIEDKVAKVDFSEELEFQVGGSCRVSAIRSQITETLKQFSSVGSVVISINGRTEDILQP